MTRCTTCASADVDLVSAGGALVGANFAGDDHAGFLRQALDRLEQFGRDGLLGDDALNDAAAVAKDGKQQFAALAQVVEPAANGDGLAFMLADLAMEVIGKDMIQIFELSICGADLRAALALVELVKRLRHFIHGIQLFVPFDLQK